MPARIAIVIPARYGSSRFPAKPLFRIAGKTMIARVCENAIRASLGRNEPLDIYVATDHADIAGEAKRAGAQAIISKAPCATGSDRVMDACLQMEEPPEIVINLQGDAPLIGPEVILKVIDALHAEKTAEVATPVLQLGWQELDDLRRRKQETPFSGTTAIVGQGGRLLWFSKNIIPAIRGEGKRRQEGGLSPVYLHLGLYGYRFAALQKFAALPQSPYETIEELEQLRFIENGMGIAAAMLSPGEWPPVSGVDTPVDAARAEAAIKEREKEKI